MRGIADWEFIARLKEARNNEQATRVLSAALAEFGYESFHYGIVPTLSGDEFDEVIDISTRDAAWHKFYRDNDLFRRDYTVLHCVRRDPRPLLWSEMVRLADQGLIPEPMAKTNRLVRDWKFGQGVTLSLRQVGPYIAGIGIAADATISAKEHDQAFNANRNRITSLVDSFHAYVDLRSLATSFYGLTKREIEVLRWLADGYREKEIAHKLGISVHTVEKQIASAKRRLKAANATQAVAKAAVLDVLT